MEGVRCLVPSECDNVEPAVEYETDWRYWSDPNSWKDEDGEFMFVEDVDGEIIGRIPGEGEDVTIPSHWQMFIDVTTANHPLLIVKGKLRFFEEPLEEGEIFLHANHIYV